MFYKQIVIRYSGCRDLHIDITMLGAKDSKKIDMYRKRINEWVVTRDVDERGQVKVDESMWYSLGRGQVIFQKLPEACLFIKLISKLGSLRQIKLCCISYPPTFPAIRSTTSLVRTNIRRGRHLAFILLPEMFPTYPSAWTESSHWVAESSGRRRRDPMMP